MISKELVSEVLKEEVVHCFMISGDDNEVYYRYYDTIGTLYINIYELAHKCKEWANSKGYVLSSATQINGVCEYYTDKGYNDEKYIDYMLAYTEPEAIFLACQWILENKYAQ